MVIFPPKEVVIATQVTRAERVRFRNLLELANSSKFEGERANALDAARRIAERHGMTLDEAAQNGLESPQPVETERDRRAEAMAREMRFAFVQQEAMARDKRRWEDAVRKARERGLDREAAEARAQARSHPRRSSKARRDPFKHAAVLLEETRLPFREIADITGLDVYCIVGMKLKMRSAV